MKFLKIITITILTLIIPTNIFAFSYYSIETQKFDKSIIEKNNIEYTKPSNIYITQIVTKSENLQKDPSKWVKSLYYYSITRLHLPDLPYTYILDENGIIYQGNSGINGDVVVGYLSNNQILSTRAESSLKQIVEEMSYNWGINQLSIVKTYIQQEEGKLSTISFEAIENEFATSVKESLTEWKGYEQENLIYKTKIEEIEYEREAVIGERITVRMKIRNMNDFTWFTDTDPIYVSTLSGEESQFAINQSWLSFSRPTAISDKNILPGDTTELVFDMEAKITLGEVEENFNILKFDGKPFEGSDINIKFEIVRGDKQLVEVASPRYSFVNIRNCRWYSCDVLDSADNGEIFILESEEEGWSQIQFGIGQYGWVNSSYLKKI